MLTKKCVIYMLQSYERGMKQLILTIERVHRIFLSIGIRSKERRYLVLPSSHSVFTAGHEKMT